MADVLLSVGRGPSGFNKLVVLKTMRKELVTDEDLRQMFLAEARLSARLNHTNVVQVYEVADTALPCIIMEYLEGQAMSEVYRAAGERYTLPLQLKTISDTLAGLHYSHELKDYDGTPLNIVHRDVSPQNVFITYDGVVKVLDFGIAKTDATSQTRTGVIKGKVPYMPREQLFNEHTDRRADVYAVGCMLWHAAAGVRLWEDLQEGEVMRALIEGSIPRPSEKRPVDPRLEEIVVKALAPDAAERYATALALQRDIDQYLAENSPKTNSRELGELVSEIFADQNEERKKHIHLALTAPKSEPSPPIPEGIDSIVQSAPGVTAHSVVTERKTRLMWTVGAAVLASVLAVAGMLVFFAWRGGRPDPAPTPTVAAPPAQIAVRVTAWPAGATLTVDGSPLSGNPALLTVPADTRNHDIRATLAGYEPYLKTVRFDHDMSLEIRLQQLPPPVSSSEDKATTKASGVSAGKKSGTVAPGGKKKGPDCNPPYYFENGIKVFRPGCV